MCAQPVADCGASGWRSELRIMAPGRGAWPGCGYAPFTFGALGDVYVCENERKEGRKEGRKRLCLPWPYGV